MSNQDDDSPTRTRGGVNRERVSLGGPADVDPGPGHSLGRFVVLAPLGEGGMGFVYAAYDPQLDRKVAVKVIRAELVNNQQTDFRARLLREAQALARLSHPNVVTVYEVGSVGDQLFFAMEFVEGTTLKNHLKPDAGWKEVLSLYVQAGRGLAAAHDAGLVHRDFKPQNVMVSTSGTARVLDFGLARPVEPAPAGPRPQPNDVDLSPAAGPQPQTMLTRTGVLMGTPGYMSPEQLAGQPVDARTDQYAFCVALFHALYGVHPYEGGGQAPVHPPRNRHVPAWIYRVLKRGLARDPAQRFPHMNALLAQLERDGKWLRRAAVGVALAAFTAFNIFAARTPRHEEPPCPSSDGEQRVRAVYGAPQHEAIQRAFLATGVPYADQALAVVAGRLDRYGSEWKQMRLDVCEATRVRHEQSTRIMELRMQCLDRRLKDVAALVSLLANSDHVAVNQAVQAAESLRTLDECSNVRTLEWEETPPDVATCDKLDHVNATAAEARALANVEDPARGLERAREALTQAKETGQLGTIAEIQLLVADLRERTGDLEGAETDRVMGIMQADASHRDALRARALVDLSLAVFRAGRPADALVDAQLASAALMRAGGDDGLQARLHHVLDLATRQLGRDDETAPHLGECLKLGDNALGPDRDVTATAVVELGEALRDEGRLEESAAQLRRAIVMQTQVLGANHPDVGVARQALAATLLKQGDVKAAIDEQRAAVEIFAAAGAMSDRLLLGAAQSQLARFVGESGDLTDAIAEQELAMSTFISGLPRRHPSIAEAWVELATLQLAAGQTQLSLASARKGRALLSLGGAPAGLLARAMLAEGRASWAADSKHRPVLLNTAHRLLEELLPRAPKDNAVLALAEWAAAPR